MNNLDCALGVLAKHREARRWTDEAVAADLLAQLRLEPSGGVGEGAQAMALVREAKAAMPAVTEPEPEPEPVEPAPGVAAQ